MENKDLQELKPVYIHEANYTTDGVINLIDLVITLINRKKLISLIIICFITLGVVVALISPKIYTYSTSIEIGSQIINGAVESFESPQTLLAKLQHSFIPQTLNEHKQHSSDNKKQYKIKASVPKSSNIIVLEAKGTEKQADLMSSLLQNITQKATQDHSRIFESVQKNLLSRLDLANTDLTNLGSGDDNIAEKASLQRTIEAYSAQLANLRNTREILPPMKSIEASGLSRKLIVVSAAFTGVFAAIFAAFFVEFLTKVRQKQEKDLGH